jgi:transcriptional regulator with XRE-family HTH domain
MKTFGQLISELRKERGLTQNALATQLKKRDGTAIGLAYINDIEHERRGLPAPEPPKASFQGEWERLI